MRTKDRIISAKSGIEKHNANMEEIVQELYNMQVDAGEDALAL